MAREREAITIFLWENPQEAIICIPETTMVPNIMMVHPPRTHWGREAKNCPTGGRRQARSIIIAPVAIVKRFTTFVIAISPTFCEKEVTGQQPKSAEMEEAKPSQAREPEISFSVISRLRPVTTKGNQSLRENLSIVYFSYNNGTDIAYDKTCQHG